MTEQNIEQNIEQVVDETPAQQIQETEIDNFDDLETVTQALKERKLNFLKVPRDKRQAVRTYAMQQALEDAIEEGDEEMAFALNNRWSPDYLDGGKNKDGTPRAFKDYKEFNAIIRENSPVLNERLKATSKQMEEMQREMKKLSQMAKMNFERSLQGEELSLEAQIQEAKDHGDFDRYDVLLAKKYEVAQGKMRLKEYEPPVEPEMAPEVVEWGVRNQWFRKHPQNVEGDPEMTSFAVGQFDILTKLQPGLSLNQKLDLVTKQTERAFPERFPAKVSSKPLVLPAKTSGTFTANKKTEIAFSSLPDGEKAQARQMIRNRDFKDEADFMKSYNKLK